MLAANTNGVLKPRPVPSSNIYYLLWLGYAVMMTLLLLYGDDEEAYGIVKKRNWVSSMWLSSSFIASESLSWNRLPPFQDDNFSCYVIHGLQLHSKLLHESVYIAWIKIFFINVFEGIFISACGIPHIPQLQDRFRAFQYGVLETYQAMLWFSWAKV